MPQFDYSPVLRQAGAEGRRWDEAQLDSFLTDPEEMFPGMWMSIRAHRRSRRPRARWCAF